MENYCANNNNNNNNNNTNFFEMRKMNWEASELKFCTSLALSSIFVVPSSQL